MNTTTIKEQLANVVQWAQSGSKLMYASIGVGVVVGLILFRLFFKHVPGLIHCVGFSVSTGKNPDVAAEPSLSSSSRLKLLMASLIPPAAGYAAYLLLPKYFPNFFQ
ncbi:MAG: hypothetical protein QOJ40_1601 [Verrucomicrobiota bacterium]